MLEPRQRLVRHVRTQVIGRVARRLDRNGVLEQARFILRCLAGHESIEVVEAVACRPTVERAHRGRFRRRRVVPFAEGRGLVAVIAQHLRDRRRGFRDDPGVAVEIERPLRDRAGADALVIAPGQQGRPRRRADRGRVELVESDALVGRRVSVGVWTSPPNVSGRPKPTSSRRTIRMFGASGGSGSARRAGHASTPATSARRCSQSGPAGKAERRPACP